MLRRESERCLVHGIARSESEEEPFWKLAGERGKGLGYDSWMSTDHVRYCDPDSDLPGPSGYCGKSCEGFGSSCGFCPVEQMVVNEDRVEAMFLAELRTLDNILEGFVGGKEDSASEPGLILQLLSH